MPLKENNSFCVQGIIHALFSWGIQDIVFCPGGRTAPIVEALPQQNAFQLYSFFEERSAAFFALGKAKKTGKAVAVVATSGTAVAELLPACIEAYYSGIPLCLITADRPGSFRGSGAPQSIEQKEIFTPYALYKTDLPHEDLELEKWNRKGPCHLNVCLEEQYAFSPQIFPVAEEINTDSSLPLVPEELFATLASYRAPLVFVGDIPNAFSSLAAKLLAKWKVPSLLDPASGMQSERQLAPYSLLDRKDLFYIAESYGYFIDVVVRLGAVPLPRAWRDVELNSALPVYSFSQNIFPGLSARPPAFPLTEQVFGELFEIPFCNADAASFIEYNAQKRRLFEQKAQLLPSAEQTFVTQLTSSLQVEDTLFVGNSLPVRHAALSSFICTKKVYTNRGANGIEGQLSTFFGLADDEGVNIGLFGDLTTLYDLTAPWALSFAPAKKTHVVVINNRGGQIFRGLFKNPVHLNSHNISFASFASMWGMQYRQVDKWESSLLRENAPTLVEFIPDQTQTDQLWQILNA